MKHLRSAASLAALAVLTMLGALALAVPEKDEAGSPKTEPRRSVAARTANLPPSDHCASLQAAPRGAAHPPVVSHAGGGALQWPFSQESQGSLLSQLFSRVLSTELTGFEEPPAVSSTGEGEFSAQISSDGSAIEYELSYRSLEGTVTQAHIHLGQKGVNGGIAVWLCGTEAIPGPAGTPRCPTPSGTVSGTITADKVVGPAGQGLAPGEFAELLRALRAGVTYANVHSTRNPGGEVRGQIKAGFERVRDRRE
jgi:hypothetical protein